LRCADGLFGFAFLLTLTCSLSLQIGWNIEQFTACVACVIDESLVPLSRLELSVSLLMEDQALADLWQHCHGHPIVLGKWTNSYVSLFFIFS
jgi:hypothetical protein